MEQGEGGRGVQQWPKETLQVVFYEAKVLNSDGYSIIQNVDMPFSAQGINTTHQLIQMRHITMF